MGKGVTKNAWEGGCIRQKRFGNTSLASCCVIVALQKAARSCSLFLVANLSLLVFGAYFADSSLLWKEQATEPG